MEASEDLRVQAVHRSFDGGVWELLLSTTISNCEKHLYEDAGEIPMEGGTREMVTGRLMIAYLTAMHAPPELRVRAMLQMEQVLDSAAYLVAAMHDPTHGVGLSGLSLEVRDSLEALTEEMNAMNLLTPYRQEDGSLAV
jgi:hypothetical protein